MISLPNSKLKLRWVRLIIFVLIFSTLIHFCQDEAERLYIMGVKAREGDTTYMQLYARLSPTEKYVAGYAV